MTDIAPSQASYTEQKAHTTPIHDNDAAPLAKAVPQSSAYDTIQALVQRYEGQLLHGCEDSACTEPLCDTGRQNTCQGPYRRYTSRSARVIAMTLASGPKSRSHLCPKYVHGRSLSALASKPRCDPTSFVQLLSDTPAVKDLIDGAPMPVHADVGTSFDVRLKYWKSTLSNLCESFIKAPQANMDDHLAETKKVVNTLQECMQWLLSTLPRGNPSQWKYINCIISNGYAYPPQMQNVPCDNKVNTWLDILDDLEHGPRFNLFLQYLYTVTKRARMEIRVRMNTSARDNGKLPGASKSWFGDELVERMIETQPRINDIMPYLVWLKKMFLHYWDCQIVRGTSGSRALPLTPLLLMKSLHTQLAHNDETNVQQQIDSMFQMPVMAARIDAVEMASTYRENVEDRAVHLLSFSFLFTITQQTTYFRTMNHLRMQKAHSDAEKASAMRARISQHAVDDLPEGRLKYLEDHYLLLNVGRANVLKDAFDQLWQRRSSELLRPLRVRLGEMDEFEIGHDLGGVQIEFFNLVCKELFSESAQMFMTDSTTGLSYFRAGSLQPLYMFELCGLLFALALYNGITLPVNFPLAFYLTLTRQLTRRLSIIADGWPTIKKSLDHIMEGDVPGLENVFPLEANGLRLTVLGHSIPDPINSLNQYRLPIIDVTPIVHHEDGAGVPEPSQRAPQVGMTDNTTTALDIDSISKEWPGWHLVKAPGPPQELDDSTKSEYVLSYVAWLVVGSVVPQFTAFLKGFHQVMPDIQSLSPRTLRSVLEGSTHLDIAELRHATTYEGYDPQSKYIQCFWRLIASWPESKQKDLLKFVTATERIPAGGVSNLTFKIQRSMPESLEHLPSSSTCFGTLLLPKYANVETLDRKLTLAMKYGLEGFGTG